MTELGVSLHAELGLVEAELLVLLADPDAEERLERQPQGRAGHADEGADGEDAGELGGWQDARKTKILATKLSRHCT